MLTLKFYIVQLYFPAFQAMLMMLSVLRSDTLGRGVWDQCGDQERHCRVVWAGGDQGEGGENIFKFSKSKSARK